MKVFVIISTFMVLSLAEPPPSNSYLPPSSNGGYPQGPQGFAPQVVAARSLDQGHGSQLGHGGHGGRAGGPAHGLGLAGAGGFGRSGALGHGAQGRFAASPDQGYDQNAAAFGRNALDEASEPANYNFGYMVNDYQEGTDFGHHEERQDERAQGEYHVVLPDGRKQTVSYEADERGFKPHVSYEDAETDGLGRSGGYDSNANNVRSGDHDHGSFANGGGHHGNDFANGRSNHGNGYPNGANSRSNNGY